MSKLLKEIIESLEKLKEVQRIQYDYFKHQTTLSIGSILIIVAFLEKVFSTPECIVLALISIISLALCLIGSLWILPETTNIIMYITGIRIAKAGEDEKQANVLNEKINASLGNINKYSWFTRITFLLGIVMFLIFSFINFIN